MPKFTWVESFKEHTITYSFRWPSEFIRERLCVHLRLDEPLLQPLYYSAKDLQLYLVEIISDMVVYEIMSPR